MLRSPRSVVTLSTRRLRFQVPLAAAAAKPPATPNRKNSGSLPTFENWTLVVQAASRMMLLKCWFHPLLKLNVGMLTVRRGSWFRHNRLWLAVIVFLPSLELSGRIETEQQNDQNEDDRSYAHNFFGQRKKIIRTRTARKTPNNGLETANQKEMSQPEPRIVGFVFTLYSQGFKGRDFTKNEFSWAMLTARATARTCAGFRAVLFISSFAELRSTL